MRNNNGTGIDGGWHAQTNRVGGWGAGGRQTSQTDVAGVKHTLPLEI